MAGEAGRAIERWALSANKITRAAFGEAMKNGRFCSSGKADQGCLPVWGAAERQRRIGEAGAVFMV